MKEELTTFEISKLAKEKGFDWETREHFDFGDYNDSGKYIWNEICVLQAQNWNTNRYLTNEERDWIISRPTQSLLQRWLRMVHNIFIEVQLDCTTEPKFAIEIWFYKDFADYKKIEQKEWYLYRTYEEALEKGLTEALNII